MKVPPSSVFRRPRSAVCAAERSVASALRRWMRVPTAPTSFPDRVGDAGSALDITGLDVESGYRRIGSRSRVTSRAATTGTMARPGHRRARPRSEPGHGQRLLRDGGRVRVPGAACSGPRAALSIQWVGLSACRRTRRLGLGLERPFPGVRCQRCQISDCPRSGFNVVAAVPSPHTDTAPDLGTFNVRLAPGTPPPPIGPDARAPHVSAYPARATHGKVASCLSGARRSWQVPLRRFASIADPAC